MIHVLLRHLLLFSLFLFLSFKMFCLYLIWRILCEVKRLSYTVGGSTQNITWIDSCRVCLTALWQRISRFIWLQPLASFVEERATHSGLKAKIDRQNLPMIGHLTLFWYWKHNTIFKCLSTYFLQQISIVIPLWKENKQLLALV